MITTIFEHLDTISDWIWNLGCFPILLILGLFLSYLSGFAQIVRLPNAIKNFLGFIGSSEVDHKGVHPLKAFFASVGGCIGIGNIVSVCTAVYLGGPGALFWLWIAAMMGMIVKYSELFLGMKFRVEDDVEGHKGGPMFFLQHAFKQKWIPIVVCVLLCLYGVEVYQFSIVVKSVSTTFSLNHTMVALAFLFLVIYAAEGGVKRVADISTWLIPIFVVLYLGMGLSIVIYNYDQLPGIVSLIVKSAFTGQAAVGGFAGSTIWLAISNGISVGCYTGDVGIGYASIIHSESQSDRPAKQASLAIVEIILDTIMICTMTIYLVLVTDVWQAGLSPEMMVQEALGQYFPYMNIFMPLFIVLLGYSTINAYLAVGILCAEYISPKYGRMVYYLYAVPALFLFTYLDTTEVLTIMMLIAAGLLIINLSGIFILRKHIKFDF